MTLMSIAEGFRKMAPEADFWSIRIVRQRGENLTVRNGILQPAAVSMDIGAMVTVCDRGGMGYAASSDLSEKGLRRSADEALAWARKNSGRMVPGVAALDFPCHQGEYVSPGDSSWDSVPLKEKIDFLKELNGSLGGGGKISEWYASFSFSEEDIVFCASNGARVRQLFRTVIPDMGAVASAGPEAQKRTFGARSHARQGGWGALRSLRDAEPLLWRYGADTPRGILIYQ